MSAITPLLPLPKSSKEFVPELCSGAAGGVVEGETTIEVTLVIALPVCCNSVLALLVVVCALAAARASGSPAAEQYAP